MKTRIVCGVKLLPMYDEYNVECWELPDGSLICHSYVFDDKYALDPAVFPESGETQDTICDVVFRWMEQLDRIAAELEPD